ncbi:hypothetical protein FRC09_002980 [Ceratobasidium sp. 395]|nr:hypothetical protein FRC09_002980 [Ceratobasidium sp. 395]
MPNTHSNQEHEYFELPPGGDVTLCSTDGVKFCVHATVLSMASSVFRDMLAVGTAEKDQVVDLAEDGQTLSLMLDFIYPVHKTPSIVEHSTLHSCLEAARKYDLNAMLGNIDAQLSQPTSNVFSNPLDLYMLGLEYALPNSRANAARRLLGGDHDFLNPASFSGLSATHPSYKNIAAVAAVQGARYKVITEVLLGFDMPHWRELFNSPNFLEISCEVCQDLIEGARHDALFTSLPGWAIKWTATTHKALAAAPFDQCLHFFDARVFVTYHSSDFTCPSCLGCILVTMGRRDSFNLWACGVKDLLESRLAALEPLYLLC